MLGTLVGRFDGRFSKPDQSGQRAANRPGDCRLGMAAVDAQLSGVLSGSGGLTITGDGMLELTASNTYTGPTTVSGGILRLSNSAALPGGTATTAAI